MDNGMVKIRAMGMARVMLWFGYRFSCGLFSIRG
jgi:hypothetical protein